MAKNAEKTADGVLRKLMMRSKRTPMRWHPAVVIVGREKWQRRSSRGGHQKAMAENIEKTAAVVVEKLANAHARGKTATVVSGKLAIGTRFN